MKVWKTKDGKEIPLDQLTTSHLNNIIAMLERQTPAMFQHRLDALAVGMMTVNGDMALEAIETEERGLLNRGCLEPHEAFPIYTDLIEERERRGMMTNLLNKAWSALCEDLGRFLTSPLLLEIVIAIGGLAAGFAIFQVWIRPYIQY